MNNERHPVPMRLRATLLAAAGALASLVAIEANAQSASRPAATPARAGAVTTESGLVYRSIREGRGDSPTAADRVKVHYRGTLMDGSEFDSSYSRNEPATFPLGRVIRCWTEGVQKMKPGGKAELTCPPQIAYGERGAGGKIPPNATLRFEVELIEVNPKL